MYPPLVVVGDLTSPLGEVGVGGVVFIVSRGGVVGVGVDVDVPVVDGTPESESRLGLGLEEEEEADEDGGRGSGEGRGNSGSIWSAGIEYGILFYVSECRVSWIG